jgi:type I restriction enzyme S subunit
MKNLGEIAVEKIEKNGPKGTNEFIYVDISSINIETKRICEQKVLETANAPSRAKQILKTGDVIVSMTRPNRNAVALVPEELEGAIGSTGFHVLRTQNAEPAWLLYAVQTNHFIDAMCQVVQGALYPAVRPKDILRYSLQVPPLDEQRRIVAEIEKQFTRLDAGVAALQRVQLKLKRYRASVLKSACEGRLVPTEAELARAEGRDYESAKVLLQRILTERREKWNGRGKYKEPAAPDIANLPELPEGWVWLTIDAIGFVTKLAGFEYTKFVEYSDDGDLPVIKAENAGRDGFKQTDFSRIKSDSISHLTRSEIKAGDVIMVFVGAGTGNVARVPDDQKYFLGPNISMIRVQENHVKEEYLELYLRSPIGNSLTLNFAKAVAQPSLSMGSIRMIPVPLPPLAEQERIVEDVERRLCVIDELEATVTANLQRATRLRQSILQKAFAGS